MLRLFENSGKGWQGSLELMGHLSRVVSANLLGEAQQELRIRDNAVDITVAPWEIITLHIWQ